MGSRKTSAAANKCPVFPAFLEGISLREHIKTHLSCYSHRPTVINRVLIAIARAAEIPSRAPRDRGPPLRVSFRVESPDRIEEGMRRLAAAVRAVL
jgi:hypothetical protein